MKEKKIEVNKFLFNDTTVRKEGRDYFVTYKMNREQFKLWRESLNERK